MMRKPEAVAARIQNTPVPADAGPPGGTVLTKAARRLRTGGDLNAEEADRTEREDEHEDREDERLAPLTAEERTAEDVDESDEETADTRADDVADATEHCGGERDDAEAETDVPLEVAVVDAVDHRGRCGERRADEERCGDRAVDVDAAQERGSTILRGGAHSLAQARALHECAQREHQEERGADHEDIGVPDGDLANGEGRSVDP